MPKGKKDKSFRKVYFPAFLSATQSALALRVDKVNGLDEQ